MTFLDPGRRALAWGVEPGGRRPRPPNRGSRATTTGCPSTVISTADGPAVDRPSPTNPGLDASPQFDPIWRPSRRHGLPGVPAPDCAQPTNWVTNLRAIDRAGRDRSAARWRDQRGSTTSPGSRSARPVADPDGLIDRCYDERRGLFMPLARPRRRAGSPGTTIAALDAAGAPRTFRTRSARPA